MLPQNHHGASLVTEAGPLPHLGRARESGGDCGEPKSMSPIDGADPATTAKQKGGPGCQASNMSRGVIMHVCEFHLSFTANWKEESGRC